MQEELFRKISKISNSSLSDGLARIIALLEAAKGKQEIHEAAYLLQQLKVYGLKSPGISLLKTSRDFFLSTKELTSLKHLKYSPGLMIVCHNIQYNASFLIHGGFSPKIDSGYTLSDILEENPDQKYFLSEKALAGVMKKMKQAGYQKKVKGLPTH